MKSTPAQYALILLDLAVQSGADRAALLAGSQLAEAGIASVGARVAESDFRVLVDNALRLTGDPALGLHLGQRLNLSAHAALGQAFMTCSTLAEVIQLFRQYYPMLVQDLHLDFIEDGERIEILIESRETGLPETFGLECMAAAMRNTLSGLIGTEGFPLRFEFPYSEPEYSDSYSGILGDDVHFDCARASWSFPRELMDTALPSSNPALRELYEAECARLLSDLRDSAELRSQTLSLLRKFDGQYPRMPQVAAMLNLSPRTFRRRLAEEDTSFQDLLDTVRADYATRQLREGRLPIASIAYRLGFGDPSNFRRAYRRWTGERPGAIRRRALSDGP